MLYWEKNRLNNTIIITMAGLGSRFRQAGFKQPKYEIEAHGRTLFEWSMLSLKNFFDGSKIIYVCLKDNQSSSFVTEKNKSLGIHNFEILELDALTDGQATSAYLSRNLWEKDSGLLVYNIDTFVQPKFLSPKDIRPGSDGWIPCFQMPGDHWSFVRLNENNWADKVTEKLRISDYASIGLYWFKKNSDFIQAYENQLNDANGLVKGERYIAPLYNQMINNGLNISIADIPSLEVHALGTPTELQSFIGQDFSSGDFQCEVQHS